MKNKIEIKPLDEEMKSFLMDNTESMQKVLIQDGDKFIEKQGNKIVWKQGFRLREINELKSSFKNFIEEIKKELTPPIKVNVKEIKLGERVDHLIINKSAIKHLGKEFL